MSYDFQNSLIILAQFLQIYIQKRFLFLSHWNKVEKNGAFNTNVTSAYIMTFHCTNVLVQLVA